MILKQRKISWGQFDEDVFKRQLTDLNSEKQPFFSTTLTLTNHESICIAGQAQIWLR